MTVPIPAIIAIVAISFVCGFAAAMALVLRKM